MNEDLLYYCVVSSNDSSFYALLRIRKNVSISDEFIVFGDILNYSNNPTDNNRDTLTNTYIRIFVNVNKNDQPISFARHLFSFEFYETLEDLMIDHFARFV